MTAKKPSDPGILPIESLYLNTNAFIAQIGAKPHQPIKHFTLRRKPKSAALRAELLHKCNYKIISLFFSFLDLNLLNLIVSTITLVYNS